MSRDYAAVDRHIAQQLPERMDELSSLCRVASVSARHENIPECAELIAASLRSRGFEADLTAVASGHPVVVGHARGANQARTLLFYCHYDVQPAEPLELWHSGPFEPVLRDGALYARGAKDDKGEFVARLAALDALKAVDGQYPCNVTFMVEGEEEVGSPHLAEWFAEHKGRLGCDLAVWEEGGTNAQGEPLMVLGRRGILYVELSVQTLAFDAHSGQANLLPSATWRLIWALATLKGQDERVLIPGFYDAVREPSARQRALLHKLPSSEEGLKRQFQVDGLLLGRTGAEVGAAVFQPTCNVAGVGGGYQGPGSKTIVPAKASAKIDFRLVPDQDPADVLAKLRRHLDDHGFADVQIEELGGYRPGVTQPDHPAVALTAEIGQEIYGKPAQIVPINWGTSPCYLFTDMGVPVVSPGVGYAGNRTHGPDEHVRLVDFENAARHLARLADRFGKGEG